MTNREIAQELRTATGNTSLALTDLIRFEENQGVVDVFLSAIKVVENMQNNAAAFEGWLLGIKAIKPDWKFRLCWDEPEEINSGHYQRFLYRVKKFEKLFGGEKGWFSTAEESQSFLDSLRVREGGNYVLNTPSSSSEDRINEGGGKENIIENAIVKNQCKDLLDMFGIDKLERQLPVGLFEGHKARNTAIFTGGKSAIDIWGIGKDKSMVIFELKAEGNKSVGVISELFFYAMVSKDEQNRVFSRHGEGGAGDQISTTSHIKAMILAPDIHPLINEDVFNLLNNPPNPLQDTDGKIEYGYIKMKPKIDFTFSKSF